MNKKGVVMDYLPWVIIAVVALALLTLGAFVMKDKGLSVIGSIKKLFTSIFAVLI